METDEGLVFSEIRKEKNIMLKEELNNFSLYPSEFPWARTLNQNSIMITNSLTEFKRRYMKAQELEQTLEAS